MAERIYKMIELVGTSPDSYEDAVERAIHKAEGTLEDLAWWEVDEFRGGITGGELEYQVRLRVAFKLH
ncbi:MAG: dodecin family protein [bacterium]